MTITAVSTDELYERRELLVSLYKSLIRQAAVPSETERALAEAQTLRREALEVTREILIRQQEELAR